MSAPEAISIEQTLEILNGPRYIASAITAQVEEHLDEGMPVVDVDAFSAAMADLSADKGSNQPVSLAESRRATFGHIVELGSSSLMFATQLAGEIKIPRPRRLHEHDQSAQNIHDEFFAPRLLFTDPRDRVLPAIHFYKDSGKAHCAALNDYKSCALQGVQNLRMTRNLQQSVDGSVYDEDEKQVIELCIREDVVGGALWMHLEQGVPLKYVLPKAQASIKRLYDECPDDYKDRFLFLAAASCVIDMAAHTERARYTDAGTQRVRHDIHRRDRYKSNDEETMMTLDRLFSEAPKHQGTVLFHQPEHKAVLRGLFGEAAEQFVVQEQSR